MELAVLLASLENVGFVAFVVCLTHLLPLWFPTGKAMTRRWAVYSQLVIALAAVNVTTGLFASEACVQWSPPPASDCQTTVDSSWGVFPVEAWDLTFIALALLGLLSIGSAVLRFIRATGEERQQLKWFALALFVFALTLGTALLIGVPIDLVSWAAALLIPASIALAVLRYRLYEIDRIVSRTVTYALIVVLFAGGYLVTTALVGSQFSEDPLFVAAATLGVAAAFNPLRKRVQASMDRRFNRSRYDLEHVIDEFGGTLRDQTDADEVVSGWVEVVSETMQPSAVGVWVRS